MRAWLATALLLVPGCLAPTPAVARLGLFELVPVAREDPVPVAFPDCEALLGTLNERALTQARVSLEQSVQRVASSTRPFQGGFFRGEAVVVEDAVGAAATPVSAAGAQVTGTNNQEREADEADILKTDGEWTYVLVDGALRILHSERVGDVASYAILPLGSDAYPVYGGQLLLERRDPDDSTDDRLVVIVPTHALDPAVQELLPRARPGLASYYYQSVARLLVFSLADRAAPAVEAEFLLEGENVGARLVDGVVHLVVNRYEPDLGLGTWVGPTDEELLLRGLTRDAYEAMPAPGRTDVLEDLARDVDERNRRGLSSVGLEGHLPFVIEQADDRMVRRPLDDATCRRTWTVPESTGRAVSTVFSVDVRDPGLATSRAQVVGGRPILYASGDALVLAAPSQDTWWFWLQPSLPESTDLTWFDMDRLDVRLRASGRVAGTVQDSFGIDVAGDRLRVATTTGQWTRWWLDAAQREPMMNHVAVFEAAGGTLVPHGLVGGIAPGERIWSARFTDERAYLVTFRNMDPLWIIDLVSEPPRILGELEIPGVSTYIHPLDDRTLLTIGHAGREGGGLDWGNPQVSLFDLSDPTAPRRADVLDLGTPGGYASSGATYEHKAFTYWDAIGTLAVPVSSYDYGADAWWRSSHVGLQLITVDRANLDLRLKGEVDQDDLLTAQRSWGGDIQRSYFLGYPDAGPVSVYALSQLGMTSNDFETLERQDAVAFDEAA